MDDRESRKFDMIHRFCDFGHESVDLFPAGAKSTSFLGIVNETFTDLQQLAAKEMESNTSIQIHTQSRAEVRESLYNNLLAISRTARAISDEIKHIEDQFRMPDNRSDKALVTLARSFLTTLTPFVPAFIEYGMDANFQANLQRDMTAFDEILRNQSAANNHATDISVKIDDALMRGVGAVNKIVAIFKNQYGDNEAIMAKLARASHIERASSPSKAPQTAKTPQPSEPPATEPV